MVMNLNERAEAKEIGKKWKVRWKVHVGSLVAFRNCTKDKQAESTWSESGKQQFWRAALGLSAGPAKSPEFLLCWHWGSSSVWHIPGSKARTGCLQGKGSPSLLTVPTAVYPTPSCYMFMCLSPSGRFLLFILSGTVSNIRCICNKYRMDEFSYKLHKQRWGAFKTGSSP